MLESYSWLIAVLPLIAFCLIAFGGSPSRKFSASCSIGAISFSLLYSFSLFIKSLGQGSQYHYETNFQWIQFGNFHLDIGILLDPLSLIMLLVVTSVSLLVQIYSHGYMSEDKGYSKFFAFLSLFSASMLGLVISTNFFQLFIFWELVGLCSYLLIGFWNYKPSAAAACMKAFVVNRIGDCGLLLGVLLLAFATKGMWVTGPNSAFLGFSNLNIVIEQLTSNNLVPVVGLLSLTTIAILILLGPMAKSAQFPLHVWLPDAMEGPTPISALIHAATMVAAGVYLLARSFPLFEAAPIAMMTVAAIGAFTAIFSATIALSQNDIKKALAYSTCSQLGYMVMAVGCGAWVAGIFHLVTHAFFKALLFLGSGSVIHGCHHEQDMREYGGLASKMPFTHATFLIGTLAISGVPLLAGFWSKEQIIGAAWKLGDFNWVYLVATITAGLTAFYMFRIYFMTFSGKYRGHAEPHESPKSITAPLIVLAIPSLFIGLFGTHLALFGGDHFAGLLNHSAAHHGHNLSIGEFLAEFKHFEVLLPLILSLGGIALSYFVYAKELLPINTFFKNKLTFFHKASSDKWYIDEV
ncbi:MAG TPA: NADH-quinone oxidoreductase subunit L, partial [Vampirovibrionales bacterium]